MVPAAAALWRGSSLPRAVNRGPRRGREGPPRESNTQELRRPGARPAGSMAWPCRRLRRLASSEIGPARQAGRRLTDGPPAPRVRAVACSGLQKGGGFSVYPSQSKNRQVLLFLLPEGAQRLAEAAGREAFDFRPLKSGGSPAGPPEAPPAVPIPQRSEDSGAADKRAEGGARQVRREVHSPSVDVDDTFFSKTPNRLRCGLSWPVFSHELCVTLDDTPLCHPR